MPGERSLIAVIDGHHGTLTEALEAALPEDGEPPLIVTADGAVEGAALIDELAHARGRRADLLIIDLGLAAGADLVARARRADRLADCPILAVGGPAPSGAARQLPGVSTMPPLRGYADFERLSRLLRELLAGHAG